MSLTIHVNVSGWPDAPEVLLRRAVGLVFEQEAIEDAELSVTLQSDADIAGLNTKYLSREGPTDVIAFALHEPGEPVLGDVYVGYGRAVAQAEERGIPLREELARLTIHGVLHVLGHDHNDGTGREQGEMYSVQESLLGTLLDSAS
ncbi:MAG: rRNA maturation RNase YbeY [Gemmatimonadota bacterium]|nr:MAG: rRNA maturation RNase YbeY [Gemmatimonadota bacterium]